ncbi:MAG: carboxypeptidase regulatory-like domain-containing protein, partial [Planctomycetaceae bacterium]
MSSTQRVVQLTVLFAPILFVSSANAQQAAGPNRVMSGIVQSPDGTPVVGAKVTLVGGYEEPEDVGSATSAADGSFSIELKSTLLTQVRGVWAEADGRIGFARTRGVTKPVTIEVLETVTYAGRIVDDAGEPIANAELVPFSSSLSMVTGMVPIPASQQRAWKTKTNVDGKFAIRQVPKAGVLSIKVATEGFGDPLVTFALDRPLEIVLRRGSPVNGRLAWPDGAKRPDGGGQLGTVSIQKYDRFSEDGKPAASLKQAAYICLYSHKQSILADGSVKFPALPPGSYSLNVAFDLETPLGSLAQKPLVVNESEPTSFEINASRAYRLSGRAVSSVDGKPVANA